MRSIGFRRDDGMPEPYGLCEHLRLNLTAFNGEEETLNPIQALLDIYAGFRTYFSCWKQLNRAVNPLSDLATIGTLDLVDVIVVVLMTLVWTFARFSLTRFMFKPFCRTWEMSRANAEKFPESAFKTLSYLVLWASACYVTFFRDHSFFSNTLSLWSDCRYKFSYASLDLRIVYALEASFYFHSIYTTIYVDKWRRDSPVMVLHHVVTLTLIGFSYSVRHLKIGVIIFVLNDISDVFLEGGKCCVYLKVRGARFKPLWDHLSTLMSILFAITWFFHRNVFHLTKVWRSSSFGSLHSMPYLPPPWYLFFNVLVGSLYLFYMYWSYYISIFIVRIFSGKMKEIDDPRDEELEEEERQRLIAAQNVGVTPDKASPDDGAYDKTDPPMRSEDWSISSPFQKGRKTD